MNASHGGHGEDVPTAVESALVEHFGQPPQRASVSFVGVDPIEVLRFEPIPGERAYVSSGMARYPMTGPAQTVVAEDGPRAELMLHVSDPTDRHADLWRRVALLAAAPVVEAVVHAPGRTLDLGESLVPGSACTGFLVTDSPVADVATAAGPVAILQLLPVTTNELAWARVHGSAALLERLRAPGVEVTDVTRAPVSLS